MKRQDSDFIYEFGRFRVDTAERRLWNWQNEQEIELQPRPFDILVLLLEKNNQLVSRDELIECIWGDEIPSEATINTHVSRIRSALNLTSEFEDKQSGFRIESKSKRGYRFKGEVKVLDSQGEQIKDADTIVSEERRSGWKQWRLTTFILLVILVAGLILGGWYWRQKGRAAEEQKIKQIISAALMHEFIIYQHPNEFQVADLKQYWLLPDDGGIAAKKIIDAIDNLKSADEYYGPDAKPIRIDVKEVVINGTEATVKSDELWYMPKYKSGNKLLDRGERQHLVTYKLLKVNGRWLIQDTDAPYVRRSQ